MKSIYQTNFKNQKVLVRVDFNVPLNSEKIVTDNSRIIAAKKTIDKIINDGGTAILMSHLGRPKGWDLKHSLKHILKEVENTLGKEVTFIPDCIGADTLKTINTLMPGEIALMENLRFYDEETSGCEKFAKQLWDNFSPIYSVKRDLWICYSFNEDKAHRIAL